jgi:uncharacterized protein (DUF302 family)
LFPFGKTLKIEISTIRSFPISMPVVSRSKKQIEEAVSALKEKKDSEDIKKRCKVKAGFGSVPVMVTIGKTKWKTSIFPDKRSGTYLLPLKAEVRKKESIYSGDNISLIIEIQ